MTREEILDAIAFCRDHEMLTAIELALIEAWGELYPDYDMYTLSIPKGPQEERTRILRQVFENIMAEPRELGKR